MVSVSVTFSLLSILLSSIRKNSFEPTPGILRSGERRREKPAQRRPLDEFVHLAVAPAAVDPPIEQAKEDHLSSLESDPSRNLRSVSVTAFSSNAFAA